MSVCIWKIKKAYVFVVAILWSATPVLAEPGGTLTRQIQDSKNDRHLEAILWSQDELDELEENKPAPLKENTIVRDIFVDVKKRTRNGAVKKKMSKAYGPKYSLDRQEFLERTSSYDGDSISRERQWMHLNGCLNSCGGEEEYDPTDAVRLQITNEIVTVASQRVIDSFESIQKLIGGLTLELNFSNDSKQNKNSRRLRDNVRYGVVKTTPDVAELDVEDTSIFTTPIEEEAGDESAALGLSEEDPLFAEEEVDDILDDESLEDEQPKEEFVGWTIEPLKEKVKKKIKKKQRLKISKDRYFLALRNFKPDFRIKAKPVGKLVGAGSTPFGAYAVDLYHIDGIYRLHHVENNGEQATSHSLLIPIKNDFRIENKFDEEFALDTLTVAGLRAERIDTEFLFRDKVKESLHTVEANYKRGRRSMAFSVKRYAKEKLRLEKGPYSIQAKMGVKF